MLYNKNDSQTYEKEFKRKFSNFCEKSPILLSFSISPSCVQVIDESQDNVYEFPWDYTLNVKEFIHAIKEVLIVNCYPQIIKTEFYIEDVPIEEQTKAIEEGTPIDQVPIKRERIKSTPYLIDKVIVYRDIFILKNLNTGLLSRYKLNKSAVFFLKKLRNKVFSKEEAGNFFFENANLLNIIEEKKE